MIILPLNINEGVGFAAIGANVIVVDVYRAYIRSRSNPRPASAHLRHYTAYLP